jgi:flagellar basal-body rod protein FlgB
MISDLPLFQIFGAMARHAAENQRVSAMNVARADEPGYKASRVESFDAFLARAAVSESTLTSAGPFRTLASDAPVNPNGNNVSLEQEIFASTEALGQHNMALTVYSKSLDMLRTALGRR